MSQQAEPCDDLNVQSRYVRLLAVLGGVALGLVAYDVQIDNLGPGTTSLKAAAGVIAAWSFLAAGVAVWSRRPGNRLGPIMVATCFALLARQLRYSHDALLFTVFFALGELGYALVAHSALAYPSGHVTDRSERRFLKFDLRDGARVPDRDPARPRRSDAAALLRPVSTGERCSSSPADPGSPASSQDAYAVIAYGGLAAAFIVLVARKLWRATPRARWILAPLLLASRRRGALGGLQQRRRVLSPVPDFVVPQRLLVADRRADRPAVRALRRPDPLAARPRGHRRPRPSARQGHPRRHPRRARRRPSTTRRSRSSSGCPRERLSSTPTGCPSSFPRTGPTRAVTMLEHDGEPLAAVVHDPTLRDEPELIDAAAAAARLALENARLQAEVQAQLAKVKESRARIVAAGDEQRRQIERDLHDGAQQRLVALALESEERTAATRRTRRPRGRAPARRSGRGATGRGRGAPTAGRRHPPGDPHAGRSHGRPRRPGGEGAGPGHRRCEPRSTPARDRADRLLRRLRGADQRGEARRRLARGGLGAWSTRHARDRGLGQRRRRRRGGRRHRPPRPGRPRRGPRRPARIDSPPGGGTRIIGEIPCAS